MLSPKITLINSDDIVVYYFFKSLLTSCNDINGESEKDVSIGENERNNLALHTFRKIFCTQFFFKIGCILDTILERASKVTRTFPICHICISIELISDVLRSNSSTLLLLHHLGELWNKLRTIIKELVKHIVIDQNGEASNEQEVFLYEILRLWRSSVKAYMKMVDNEEIDCIRSCAFSDEPLLLQIMTAQIFMMA
ncbi:hypothetical protein MN116_003454 [Schistosoma mekongi]|uniref:Uncharacterized protein n=1 Tax=Schistosoma mekongi TaxID=38744 RepID=A0AAE1ZHL9_SCHME|nr:hypothetical protein MN116_003454 [Schistosoma mekongi]